MHRDQRLPFERTFRERYIEAIGIARLLDADPDADEKNAHDRLRSGDETGNNGLRCGQAKLPPDSCGEAARVDKFRSEEHTSELQSLMRISYAVFCLKKKNT